MGLGILQRRFHIVQILAQLPQAQRSSQTLLRMKFAQHGGQIINLIESSQRRFRLMQNAFKVIGLYGQKLAECLRKGPQLFITSSQGFFQSPGLRDIGEADQNAIQSIRAAPDGYPSQQEGGLALGPHMNFFGKIIGVEIPGQARLVESGI